MIALAKSAVLVQVSVYNVVVDGGPTARPILNTIRSALIACLCLSFGNAFAQSGEKEPVAVVDVGGSASQSVIGNGASFGPTVAVEVTPIENLLEPEGFGSVPRWCPIRPRGSQGAPATPSPASLPGSP